MSQKAARFRVAQELREATALSWAQIFRLAAGHLIDGMDSKDYLLSTEPAPRLTAREARNERYEQAN